LSWGDPSKLGVLLLHGFLAHARCFAFITPFLAKEYYVVAYDFFGMGDSKEVEGDCTWKFHPSVFER
jgi:pimeloyl-ACP methyl ester carboxylesterase